MSKSKLFQLFLVIFLVIAGIFQVIFRDVWPSVRGGDVELVGSVYQRLDQDGARQRVRVRNQQIPGLVQLEVGGYPRLQVGDVVEAECELKPIRDLYVEEFRYDRYLAKENVYALCKGYGSPRVTGVELGWRRTLSIARDTFARQIQSNLHEPHASLLIGLLYGARSTLPDSLTEAFRRTGTMHIVAVSGFNVMVVGSALMTILTFTFLKRQRAFYLVLAGISFFVLFAGADAAVVRAGIMGGMTLVAKQVGRLRVTTTLFLLAASVMVAINPRVLFDDVGFQLSFAAALGLVIVGPRIAKHLLFLPQRFGLRSILAETLAATLATIPISLWHFKVVSLISPIANLFVVPWIVLAMSLGVFGTVLSILPEPLGTIGFLPAYVVLDIMLALVRVFAPLPIIDFAL